MVETVYTLPGCPVSIALLADLHNTDPAPVIRSLEVHRPDMIAVAGDVLYGSQPVDDISPLEKQMHALPFLSLCASIAPTFLSLGNHEWMLDEADSARIADTGAVLLDNTCTALTVGGLAFSVGGLTSAHVMRYRKFLAELSPEQRSAVRYPEDTSVSGRDRFRKDFGSLDTSWLTAFCSFPGYHVLLCHHPEYFGLVPRGVELVLSGHAHGGQWRIFGHGVIAPGQGIWPKLTSGVHDGRLVISRGLSNTLCIPRLFNPTEIVYIEGER